RFELRLTMGQEMHDKLQRARDLLSHRVPSRDIVQVLDRALDALIVTLEKRKYGATDRPQPSRGESCNARRIPARVRRAVRERDGERCTFVNEAGQRCDERALLEFDHVLEIGRGGMTTAENLRLRCRAHNQYT